MTDERDKYGMTPAERRLWWHLNAMWWVLCACLVFTLVALVVKVWSMFHGH